MISLLFAVVVAGFCLWLVNALVPMAPPFKTIFNVLVALILVWLILSWFGFVDARTWHHRW